MYHTYSTLNMQSSIQLWCLVSYSVIGKLRSFKFQLALLEKHLLEKKLGLALSKSVLCDNFVLVPLLLVC